MPFVDTTQNNQLPIFFNVNMSVGRHGRNAFLDVLLVKYLLRRISERTTVRPAALRVPIDGIVDRATIAAILDFQQDDFTRGKPCIVDGRVDRSRVRPIRGDMIPFPTIISLNTTFLKFFPEFFPRIGADPHAPRQLVSALTPTFAIETAPASNSIFEGAPSGSNLLSEGAPGG